MKLLLIALCIGVTFAIEEWQWLQTVAPDRQIQDSAFRPGREYQFFYNGQLASGITGASKQHAVNRIQALVTISIKNQNNVLLRLQNIRIGKMNRQIPNPRKIMPFEAFEDSPLDQHLKQKLEAPLKFSYINGMVKDVEFDSREEPWSANVKRGVLNLLQVNLHQQRRVEAKEESPLQNARLRSEESGQEPIFYRVMEDTLEGECETLYSIQRQPDRRSHNQPVLNVTKTINFEKCNKRPQIKYNFRFTSKCPTCNPEYENDDKFLKSSTIVQYNITGDKHNFLIDMARTESQYIFTPFNEEGNVIVTYVNQTLVLLKTGPIQQIQEPQNPVKSDSNMIFNLDWDIAQEKLGMHGSSELTKRILQPDAQGISKVEIIRKLIQKIASEMKEQVDENVPRKFSQLIDWLRLCDQQDLEPIVRMQDPGQLSPEEEKKVKNIIPQALGACGTRDCAKQLIQKIRQGQISPMREALALKGLLQSRVTSKETIQDLIQLAESEKARENEILKRACWLSVGSLMNALCSENEDQLALEIKEDTKNMCTRGQKDSFVKTLFDKLRQANKWQDKVLMLKTIANAGLDLGIFDLEKLIHQQESPQPVYVRMEAILALRQLMDDMPKKIQRILMPVALDRREYPSIRSMASYMLLLTNPERHILDQMARSLINEPSHQFASLLYSQLESFANSTNPCEKQLATNAKLALRQAKKLSTSLGYSKFWHFTFHNEKQNLGLDVDVGAIYTNTSFVPRHMGVSFHSNRMGYWHKHFLTLSLLTEGLESFIRDYSNQGGFSAPGFPLSNSLAGIIGLHPRNIQNGETENERDLQEISSKYLKIRHRQYSKEYENDPKAYFTAMFKSQTVVMLPASKEIIQQAVQEATGKLEEMSQKLQRGLPIDYQSVAQLHEIHLKIPTTLGFPLAITVEAPAAISIKGKIQANLDTPSSKTVKMQAELKPSSVATFQCKVEAWSPMVVSGVKIQAKSKMFVPIDTKIEIEWGQRPQIRASIKPPTQKRDLLVLESRPITFIKSWQQYLQSGDEESSSQEVTISGEEVNRVSTFNKCVGRQTLGLDMCVRGQVQNVPAKSPVGTPFGLLSGQNKIVVTSNPSQSNQDIQIKISSKIEKINGQEQHKPQFSILGHQSIFDSQSSSESSSEDTSQARESQETSAERRQTHQRSPQHLQRHPPGQQQLTTFQQYRNYQIKSGYKSKVEVELQAANSRSLVELSHLSDSKQRYGKVNLKIDRQQPDQWQACLDAEMMYPEDPQSIDQVKDKKILGHAQIRWGQTCSSQNFIQITTQAERSRQQMLLEKEVSQYMPYNSKQHCQNNTSWCSPLTQEDFLEKMGHMMKYRLDIDYQNVPPAVQNVTNNLYRALKYYYYSQTEVNEIDVRNPEGKIRSELVLDAETKQRVNITIQTPRETIMMQDLPLSKPLLTLNQKQSFADQLRQYVNENDEDDDQSECSVTGKPGSPRRSQVETFDGTKFTAPFTNCWVVLAKDCASPKPEFVVMARKPDLPGGDSDLKEVKIITRQNRIELKPDSSEYDSIKVKVNGQAYDPENDEDITDHGHIIAKIDKKGQFISVDLPETGVQVEFDGYAINIKLSSYYHGQQCGLCGHFDMEEDDEFRNPDFTEEKDLRQFYMNYLIKDGRCEVPKQLSEVCESEECGKESSSSSEEDKNVGLALRSRAVAITGNLPLGSDCLKWRGGCAPGLYCVDDCRVDCSFRVCVIHCKCGECKNPRGC